MENQNLPAVSNHVKIATELVLKYKGQQDLVFVSDEELKTQSMFYPEIVAVHAEPSDFHKIGSKFMPKKHIVDRIAEAAGITFLEQNCGTRAENIEGTTVWIGFSQGKKRMPDGSTWRTSSVCEYEFNPALRAEEEILKNPGKYKDDVSKKLKVLELKKFARQRANTGARLRTIHELTGMQTSFEAGQLKRALVYSRVAVNTDLLLADPKTREVALEAALGITRQIYGPPKEEPKALSDHYTVEENGNDSQSETQDAVEKDPWDAPTTITDEEKNNLSMLEDVINRRKEYDLELSDGAKADIDKILNLDPIDYGKISSIVDRLDGWEEVRKKRDLSK